MLQRGDLALGFLCEREDVHGHVAVDFRSGEFFEEHGFLCAGCFEEVGETVLREDDGAGKLGVGETDGAFYATVYLIAVYDLFLRSQLTERAFWRTVVAASCDAYAPRGFIAFAVGGGEHHGATALLLSAAQDVGRARGLYALCFFGGLVEIFLRYAFDVFKARGFVVECQANGVENGAFAGARVAGDGKESGGAQGLLCEVYGLFALDGCEVVENYFFNLHFSFRPV